MCPTCNVPLVNVGPTDLFSGTTLYHDKCLIDLVYVDDGDFNPLPDFKRRRYMQFVIVDCLVTINLICKKTFINSSFSRSTYETTPLLEIDSLIDFDFRLPQLEEKIKMLLTLY